MNHTGETYQETKEKMGVKLRLVSGLPSEGRLFPSTLRERPEDLELFPSNVSKERHSLT